MICGATSGAGKSTVTAALCRSWARRGLRVAPFKAQNMSNHAAVTTDGGEVGRAQAMQALAAGVPLDRRMNPILLKPNSATGSHLVVLGDEVSTTDAHSYGNTSQLLRPIVLGALTSLRSEYDWVVAEGAGGAAEINLLERDLVNLPLARAAGVPALLVVDIDPGGAFASAYGTIDILPPELREPIVGVVFNKFRGDASLLDTGIAELERRTGVPVLGVLPHLADHLALGVEDSLDIDVGVRRSRRSKNPVRVAAIRLPHLANPSDLDPFAIEPDVEFQWASRPGELSNVDLVVIPGSRATVADLAWLQAEGFAEQLNKPERDVVGICAGFQMLGKRIHDDIESGLGTVDGLGLLDVETTFEHPKIVTRSTATVEAVTGGQHSVGGYQIRFGRPTGGGRNWLVVDGEREGAVDDDRRVYGTSLHSVFDADGFRSEFLASVAAKRQRQYEPASTGFSDELGHYHDRLADWIEAHLDSDRLLSLAASAQSPGPGW
ncbi:MAG: cobyric acid synthase [Acidimicrobiales bacterium]